MSTQLMTHTQQAVILSLNVITQDDTGTKLEPIPLIRLTRIIFMLWSIRQSINRQRLKLATIADGITTNFLNGCEIFYIATNAIAWGVRL